MTAIALTLPDAYRTLLLPERSPLSTVRRRYRTLALECHPDRPNGDHHRFLAIQQAYKYICHVVQLNDEQCQQPQQPRPPPTVRLRPNHYELWLTLEEVFVGCDQKEVTIARQIRDSDGTETVENVVVSVPLGPTRTFKGSRITVENAGDRAAHQLSANAVFTVHYRPHSVFSVRGRFDLEYTVSVTTSESVLGCTVKIPKLEGDESEVEVLQLTESITDQSVRVVPGRGLPRPMVVGFGEQRRGNLRILFKVVDEPLPKDPPIEHTLYLSLHEVLTGKVKRLRISRTLYDSSGNSCGEESQTVTVNIARGTVSGTRFEFASIGDRRPNSLPADLVVVTADRRQLDLVRENNVDVVHIARITPEEAYLGTGVTLTIPTIDQGSFERTFTGEIDTAKDIIFSDLGLPHVNEPNKRGKLRIRFVLAEQDDPIEQQLWIEPEEAQEGCTKVASFTRHTYGYFGKLLGEELKQFTVEVKPNTRNFDKFTIARAGHRSLDQVPADLVFLIRFHPKDPPVEHTFELSLEQVATGKVKQFRITRTVIGDDGEEREQSHLEKVHIRPGTPEGHRYTFHRASDHNPGKVPADVVFVLRYKKHAHFRVGGWGKNRTELHYKVHIANESTDLTVDIPTLFDYVIPVPVDGIHRVLRIPAHGLPRFSETDSETEPTFDDLVVHFVFDRPPVADLGNTAVEHSPSVSSIPSTTLTDHSKPKCNESIFGSVIPRRPSTLRKNVQPNNHKSNRHKNSHTAAAQLPLALTAHEMAVGCTRRRRINRQVFDHEGNVRIEHTELTVVVECNTTVGQTIVCAGQGDQDRSGVPADVVFVVKLKPG